MFCSEQRTQAANRERAFAILRAKLFEAELQKQQAEVRQQRQSQVRPPLPVFRSLLTGHILRSCPGPLQARVG